MGVVAYGDGFAVNRFEGGIMREFMFEQPLWLLLLLPVVVAGLVVWKAQRRVTQIRTKMDGAGCGMRSVRWFGVLAAVWVVLALARPVSDPEPSPVYREGRDVVFVLDVSRSMLAQDMQPSRLERAKLAVRDCMEFLPGGRIGLVLFAGSASIRCPLTEDRVFLQTALEESGPGSVSYGSTFLQSAVEKVTDRLLNENRRGFQDVIFLTDGGDHGEDTIQRSAAALRSSGARVLVVGFGNSEFGARIPVPDGEGIRYLQEEGAEVRVKQEQSVLREFAERSGGIYLDANTGMFHLGSAYQSLSVDLGRATSDGRLQMKYKQRFGWCLLAALVCLFFAEGMSRMRRWLALLLLVFSSVGVQAQESNGPAWADALARAESNEECLAVLVGAARDAWVADDFQTTVQCYQQAQAFGANDFQRAQLAYAESQALSRAAFAMLGEDPYVAASMAEEAELSLLAQRRIRPTDAGVLRDLCCVYEVQAEAVLLIKAQEQADEQMQQQMEELLQRLEALVKRQHGVVNACRPLRPARRQPKLLPEKADALCEVGAAKEKELADDLVPVRDEFTGMAAMMSQLLTDRLGIENDEGNEFVQASNLLGNAVTSLKNAQAQYRDLLGLPGLSSAEAALRKMEEVLSLFSNQQSSEEGESEEYEDDEGDYEMSDEWGDGEMQSMPMDGQQGRMDMNSRQLPEPQFSAEEILQEESENNRAREQKSRGGDNDVKKDW